MYHDTAIYVTGSWKTYLLGTSKVSKNSVENLCNHFKIKLLHVLIRQLLKLLAVKFHTKIFFFLGGMDDYISVHIFFDTKWSKNIFLF